MRKSILRDKSYAFAIRVINLCKSLQNEQREFILSKQLVKCGTAIGALIREAEFGQSRADFLNKMSIALKEANEAIYWLVLLQDTGYLVDVAISKTIQSECQELISMLVATIKTLKGPKH